MDHGRGDGGRLLAEARDADAVVCDHERGADADDTQLLSQIR